MPARILVVDDNELNLKLITVVLSTSGYDVRGISEASEALAAVAEFQPAVILMDLQLPGIDGFELTRRLKANPATMNIAVVAVTAYAMKGDEERARAAGCDGYITKPLNTRTLGATVATYLPRA